MNDYEDNYELQYYFNGLENLTQFLQVVEEISAETGMSDWVMTHRGIRMAYCWQDAKAVIKGAMSEETYIVRNRLPDVHRAQPAAGRLNKKIYFFGRRTLPHKCPAFFVSFPPGMLSFTFAAKG